MACLRPALLGASMLALTPFTPSAVAQDSEKPVRMSQIGFEAGGPMRAVIVTDADSPLPWRVVRGEDETVREGETEVFGPDAASGQSLHRADLTGLEEGDGYVFMAGEYQSRPFPVTTRPWSQLSQDALSLFHQNRAGIGIEERHVERPDLARLAGHETEILGCFSGADQTGRDWPGCGHELDVTGGWYDAGDHGKYVVNGGIAVWTLLDAYARFGAAFGDETLPIPEAGNGNSDLLDEIRWGLDFLLAMQIPDGARMSVLKGARDGEEALIEVDAGGLAHHKAHNEHWTPLPFAPHEDDVPRFLYPPSTAATLNLAAAAARCARVWAEIDPDYAARCLEAAERAWAAAERHPDLYAANDFDGGGAYGDGDVTDEVYWAASELYAATGEAGYGRALRASPHFTGAPGAEPDTGHIAWPQVGALGTIVLLDAETLPEAEREQARASLIAAADGYLAIRDREGYAIPLDADSYVWGSNGDLMNRAMVLALAHDLTGQARYREGVIDAMDYVLGRNALDQSYVTGYGARSMRNPHHRYWAHASDPDYPEPPSGVISGGPNATNMSDPVAAEMRGTCAPQTCWADHIDAYALNEVAINWNAPFFWVAAWLDS